MSEQNRNQQPEIQAHAQIVSGETAHGKPCRLIDNTGNIPHTELQSLLDELIDQGHFGLKGLSSSGSNTIVMGAPEMTHIQIAEEIYRLVLLPYEAYLEHY